MLALCLAACSHSELTLQDSLSEFTAANPYEMAFTGKRKGQGILALLAAHAMNSSRAA